MNCAGVAVPPYGLNSTLRIDRAELVAKIIHIAEGPDQQVYIRGAAGTGKTVLLELVALQLARERKTAVIVSHAGDFESLRTISPQGIVSHA